MIEKKLDKYLSEAMAHEKIKGYKIVKPADTCSSCKFSNLDTTPSGAGDFHFCENPQNIKAAELRSSMDASLYISFDGWCPKYKRSR